MNRKQLATGLNKISFDLNLEKSLMLADSLLKHRQYMPVSELLSLLKCVEDENTNDTWLNTMCRRVKIQVMTKKNVNVLHDIFTKFDIKN